MRNNQPVTQQERRFPDEQRLISITDLHGRIRYCNDAFVQISGFDREQLVGAEHNIVRHPDVPPAVFAHMWQHLKQGKPWMGIVKNRRQNGDHYWVNAYVTPIFEGGTITGYESVRSKPTPGQIRRAEQLYRRLNNGQPAIASSHRWLPLAQDWLPFILISQIGFLIGSWLGSGWGFALAALLSVPLGLAGLHWQQRVIRRLLRHAEDTSCDALTASMYTDSRGAEARLEMAMHSQRAHLRTGLTRLQESAMHLYQQATQAEELAQHSAHSLHQQRLESEQVATAVQQMAATTGEVAQHVQQAAQASQQARQLSGQGQQVADGTRAAIEQLATLISGSSDTVARVAEDSREIGGMVEVIRSIAEQTNLLALNAAIEAARAGDMGRGFAVVADEVRALAQRTGQSTEQIQQLISRLQQTAQAAVDSMRNGQDQAATGVQRVLDSHLALQGINQAVAEISGMTEQIASAMEEQSSVALQISHSISSIATHTEQASQEAQRTSQLSETLKQTAASQQALVERFNR